MSEWWALAGVAASALVWGGVAACWLGPKVVRSMRPVLAAARTNPLRAALGAVFVGALIAYGATKPYAVAYHANGGEGSMPRQTCTNDLGEVLSTNLFTRIGYSFGGWATNATGAAEYGDGDLIIRSFSVSNMVVDLFAVWNGNSYQVAFDANGGTGEMAAQEFIYGEAQPLSTNVFACEGHSFSGWALSPSGTVEHADGAVVSNLTAEADETVTLYAVWEENAPPPPETYQVVFNPNGGEGSAFTNTFSIGMASTLPSNTFVRAGYAFEGWATTSTGAVAYADGAVVSNLAAAGATIILYAVWIEIPSPESGTYYVVFDPNGGEGEMLTNVFEVGVAQALPSNTFARTGYTFSGWATSSTGEVAYADSETVSNLTATAGDAVALYACWEANEYQVVFSPNGGMGQVLTQACVYASSYELPTNWFTRVGYVFGGWAASASATNATYQEGQTVSNLTAAAGGTAMLYAFWTPLTTQMVDGVIWRFDATGGSATVMGVDTQRPDLVIPATLGGVPVTAIGDGAFEGCTWLRTIGIPSTVTSIGEEAFAGCTGISSLTLRHDLDGEYPEEDAVTIGEGAFSGCTSLSRVELPLGVSALPDGLFANCTALTDFEMPYTVTSVGAGCFSNCTALTAITVTENVTEIGSKAFTGCTRLKIVRYLGNCPEAESDIYYHANASLVSGRLSFRTGWPEGEKTETEVDTGSSSSDDATDTTGVTDTGSTNATATTTTVTVITTPKWPEGTASRPVLLWETTLYQFCRVTFDCNDGGKTKPETRIYVKGRMLGALGDLPEPGSAGGDTDDDDDAAEDDVGDNAFVNSDDDDDDAGDEGEFIGWFTGRYSGTQVTEATVVTAPVTYYAHWSGDDDSERGVGAWDDAMTLYDMDSESPPSLTAAVTYDAYLLQDDQLVGTAQFKLAKGKRSKTAEETTAAVKATVNLRGRKKISLKGTVDESGAATLTRPGSDEEWTLSFGANGVIGESDDGIVVDGARNRFSSSNADDKRVVAAAMERWKKTWMAILRSDASEAEGTGAAFADGHSALSVAVGNKGKTKVFGFMADGTKVSLSTQLLVGDGVCAVPVSVPLYAGKKGGFGFLLWLPSGDSGDEGVAALSGWDATANKTAPFSVPLEAVEDGFGVVGAVPLASGSVFALDGTFEPDEVAVWEEFLPGMAVTVSGGRWTLPAKGSVKFVKDDEEYVDGRDSENPSGLNLKYAPKTGLFTGSFKVYGVNDAGKAKSYTAKVTGGVVGGVGYGTAVIKKVGSASVTIGGE